MAKLVNQSQAAKHFGVDPTTIRDNIAQGGPLCAAVMMKGNRRMIDLNHPDAKEYEKKQEARRGSGKEIDSDLRKYRHMTLDELLKRYGTLAIFKDLVTAQDKIEGIYAKRLSADKSTGELIEREYVRKHVLGLVEATNQRLLTEVPQNLGIRIHGLCQTGATPEQCQELLQNGISRELKSIKQDVQRSIKNASG